eukprot:PhM_4_TR2410/c0_g1_i3/m.27669
MRTVPCFAWTAPPRAVSLRVSATTSSERTGEPTNMRTSVVPDHQVVDASNGDGGVREYASFVDTASKCEVWFFRYASPCRECLHVVNTDTFLTQVVTTAVRLDVVSLTPTLTSVGLPITLTVRAVDSSGFVDANVGGVSDCKFYHPFTCTVAAQPMTLSLSSNDGPKLPTFNVGGEPSTVTLGANFHLVDGIARDVSFTLSKPARLVVATIVTPQLKSAPSTAFGVSVGSNALSLVSESVQYDIYRGQPLTVRLGFVKTLLDGVGYVSSSVNAAVEVAVSGCATLTRTVRATAGIAHFVHTFALVDASVDTSKPCAVTATAQADTSYSCVSCSVQFQITVRDVKATSWVWLRPTAAESSGGLLGPKFAAAGQVTEVAVALKATVNGNQLIDAPPCASCRFTFTAADQDCGIKPTLDPIEAFFDENGRTTMKLAWPTVTTPHACTFEAAVVGGLDTIVPPTGLGDGTVGGSPLVEVCVAARVVLVTNITSYLMTSSYLRTGYAYSVVAAVLDTKGSTCLGDTQESATKLTIDVVGSTGGIAVVPTAGNSLTQSVVAGRTTFSVMFTSSTYSQRAGPIRLRVSTASKIAIPTAYSTHFDTNIVATRLVLSHTTPPPTHFVIGRVVNITVMATDDLGNVASLPSQSGNDAPIEWLVEPQTTQFPLVFVRGQRQWRLENGVAKFSFSVASGRAVSCRVSEYGRVSVAPTPQFTILLQTPQHISIVESATSAPCIHSPCTVGAPFVRAGAYLNITTGTPFVLHARIVDDELSAVLGENKATLGLRLIKVTGTSVALSAMTVSAITTEQGSVSFATAFIGTTGTTTDTFAALQIYCVTTEWCGGLAPITTRPISVSSLSTGTTSSNAYSVVTIPMGLPSLSALDVVVLRNNILAVLSPTVTYLTAANKDTTIGITACEVIRGTFPDASRLGHVCGVTPAPCGEPRLSTCPVGVVRCVCSGVSAAPVSTSRRSRAHHVLDVTIGVQVDVSFNLLDVPELQGSDADTYAGVYTQVAQTLVAAVSSPTNAVFASYNVNTSATGYSFVTPAPTQTATPTPTQVPPVTTAPTTVPPITAGPLPTSDQSAAVIKSAFSHLLLVVVVWVPITVLVVVG